ncbi:ubiquitin-conjugating enzyme E2 Z-like [Dermacentor albipictus]|uniref:ubiquitin-conjugating enzyme E2 Z-like n=1 Tax=Dermacentor albipictus TaxID=60249 RepID=UPI0038FC01C3
MHRIPDAAAAKASVDEPAALAEHGPLAAASGPVLTENEQPSPQCLHRVQRDLAEFAHHPPPGVFIEPEKEDITTIHAVIVGPAGTLHEGGFFHFVLKLPPDYPVQPPLVRFMTTDGGRVGFSPNLHADGKVCITFPRPPWSAALSLECVLVSVQSLINENASANEPGLGHIGQLSGRLSGYNDNLRYQTLKVAVCDAVEACLLGTAPYPPALRETVLARFAENYGKYEEAVRAHLGSSFLGLVFCASNVESQKYRELLERLRDLHRRVSKENARSADRQP